jgi:hypothetical protein
MHRTGIRAQGWTQTCAPDGARCQSPQPTSRLTARNNFANRNGIWLLRLRSAGLVSKVRYSARLWPFGSSIDAFTNRAFAGNPAASACLELAMTVDARDVAREMNLSGRHSGPKGMGTSCAG